MSSNAQRGFTLIELIIVIVILGILSAVALPKFVDLSSDADLAAIKGVSGAAGSAMAINYAGCAAVGNVVTANKCVRVDACSDVADLLQGGVASGYTVASSGTASTTNGVSFGCSVSKTASPTNPAPQGFSAIAAGNP